MWIPFLVLEDLVGHEHHGSASVWQLREFQVLECDHDARRGAGFLCQLAHAEQKRPLGILTTLEALHSDLCMGWPKFVWIKTTHFLGIVDALLSTHLWLVTMLTNIFSHLFRLPFDHCSGNVFGRLKLKRNSPLGMGSLQITSLHHCKAPPLHLDLTLVNDCSTSGNHGV